MNEPKPKVDPTKFALIIGGTILLVVVIYFWGSIASYFVQSRP